jgi:hypothetical protein
VRNNNEYVLNCFEYFENKLNTQSVWEKLRNDVSLSKEQACIYTDTNVVLAVTAAVPYTQNINSRDIRSAGV